MTKQMPKLGLVPDYMELDNKICPIKAVWTIGNEDYTQESDDDIILYQDSKYPQNFCLSTSDYNSLGYYVERNEVMYINKFVKKKYSVSMERKFGVWTVIPTPCGMSWNFDVYNTYQEAIDSMHEQVAE